MNPHLSDNFSFVAQVLIVIAVDKLRDLNAKILKVFVFFGVNFFLF